MKIVITGSKGQLGNELIKSLKTMHTEIGEISESYKETEYLGIDIEDLDISDLDAVRNFMNKEKPSIIINCAAMTNVDGCESKLKVAMKANALGPRNLAIVCNEINAKLVQISTDYVFEGEGKIPYCEWDLPDPQSVYGKSKCFGETYVKDFCNKYFIIRTSWLYGYIGNNFVKTMLKLGKEKEEIKVVNDQIGNPTNANDLAHHILKVALTEEYGIYHCTGTGECSWYNFTCKIMEYANLNCKVIPCTSAEFNSPTKRPSFSSLNNLMLSSTVGDEMRDWKIALKEYISKIKES